MSPSILVTKLFIPPLRPELVSRPQLLERIDHGLRSKLTLISAPAGFGKTTLITEWIQTRRNESASPLAVAWLSLDEGDNDPMRFLTYMIAALNQIEGMDSSFGTGAQTLLQSSQTSSLEAVLTELINELVEFPARIVLVLDDYHLIEAQAIHSALRFLLENLPQQLHLVINTREDPPLPLSKLRSRMQLTELRAVDLCFTSEEVAKFLNQVMGLGLASADIAVLEARTEGWIAGLQLAALSMQGRADASDFIKSFAGSNRLVLDYLIDEVLDQQSADLQDFLLQTAILDRFTGPLCDAVRFGFNESAVANPNNGQQVLELLEQSNLFIIPLDDERCWYRYHHLFADLLRQRLQQNQPEQVSVLHRRASEWYERQGFGDESIDHALRGADYERAAELIDTNVGGNYEQVAPQTLQRWLAAMPDELTCAKPRLCLLRAWNQFTSGQLEVADQSLQVVAYLLDADDQLSNMERHKLSGRAAAISSFIASYRGDLLGSIQLAQQAFDILPDEELAWRSAALITLGDAYAAQGQMNAAHQIRSEALTMSQSSGNPSILMIANLNLAETLWQQGQLQSVIEICERQMKIAEEHSMTDAGIVGWLLGLWGAALAELNQLDRALELTQNGVELAERGQDVTYISYSSLHQVSVLFSAMDWAAAEDVIYRLTRSAHKYKLPLWATCQASAWQARIWLAQGKLDDVVHWADERSIDLAGELQYSHEAEYVVMARIMISQGRLDEAVGLLDRLRVAAEIGGRTSQVVELLLLQALAAQSDQDTAQALPILAQALDLAEARGFIRKFVNEGPAMARLLYEVIKHGSAPEYVQRLLAAFPADEPRPVELPQSNFENQGWLEPLSDREMDVLQLMAEGLTNPEIGDQLYLSPHTIKAHARSIYSKLDVNNRTQAVNRARALGLLFD